MGVLKAISGNWVNYSMKGILPIEYPEIWNKRRMFNAIYAITVDDETVNEVMKIYMKA